MSPDVLGRSVPAADELGHETKQLSRWAVLGRRETAGLLRQIGAGRAPTHQLSLLMPVYLVPLRE